MFLFVLCCNIEEQDSSFRKVDYNQSSQHIRLTVSSSLAFSSIILLCIFCRQVSTATVTNNFSVSNAGTINLATLKDTNSVAHKQVLGAYKTLVAAKVAAYDTRKLLTLGTIKLATIVQVTCPTYLGTTTGSLCHNIAGSFTLQYDNAKFPVRPATPISTNIQTSINAGALDCNLRKAYPGTVMSITTGGGCGGTTTGGVYDSNAQGSNGFFISVPSTLSTTTLSSSTNTQNMQLTKAYNALITDALSTLIAKGLKLKEPATIPTFIAGTGCATGTKCFTVSTSFSLLFNSKNFPAGGVSTQALNLIQNAINSGKLICSLNKLYPSSSVKVVTGGTCSPSRIR